MIYIKKFNLYHSNSKGSFPHSLVRVSAISIDLAPWALLWVSCGGWVIDAPPKLISNWKQNKSDIEHDKINCHQNVWHVSKTDCVLRNVSINVISNNLLSTPHTSGDLCLCSILNEWVTGGSWQDLFHFYLYLFFK